MLNQTLLDQEINTKLTLLSLLYRKNDWYLMEELIVDSSLDRNTVSKYIHLLKEEIPQLSPVNPPVSIIYSKARGLRFVGDKIAYQSLISTYVDKSIGVALLKDLLILGQVSIDQFNTQHFVSESSVRRKISQLNKLFLPHSFSIRTSRRQIFLLGDELQIRYYGYIFFWELYKGLVWPFPHIDEHRILEFIDREFKPLVPLKKISILHWSYIIALNIARFIKNNSVNQTDLPSYSNSLNQALKFEGSSLKRRLMTKFSFSEPETDYLFLLFQTGVRIFQIDFFFDRCINFHKQENTEVYQMFQLYFSTFDPDFSLIGQRDQNLYKYLILSTFTTVSLFPNFSTTLSGYDYLGHLDDNYPSLHTKIEEKIDQMRCFSSSTLLDNKNFLTIRFCEAYALIGNLTDFDSVIQIKLETDLPIIMERILSKQLFSILSPFHNIKFIPPTDFVRSSEIDLVIASTLLSKVTDSKESPIIFIHPDLQLSDITSIVAALENLKK
ncbi:MULTISPECIES: helix-turn-helix domain-containing protein [unclassified Enterococcus]|uniref:helix-turn-helix domain-containing protein n=1 Tax=unclassified Enterococcus TaxID=2608891 RepID=UPI001CE02DF5|nr:MULTISPECIES: helix-turn-helix domain-containing protein [unclassified Enterococcus]MCA5011465.1 helix-turn-helix domain-containing protein [Enterococcus sp. S23]MCA5015093.1 helix-turn-helix domain-containing protein [Enterococcus sp. S22(2020)]